MASTSKDQQQTKDAYTRLNSYITIDREIINPHYVKLFIEEKIRTSELDFSSQKGEDCILNAISHNREDVLNSIYKYSPIINEKSTYYPPYWKIPLSVSASHGATECMKILLEYGACVNMPDANGSTPLMHCNNVNTTKILLENGADIEACDFYEETPLLHASRSENTEVVQFLVERGANVNCSEHTGKTPLMVACDILGQTVLSKAYTFGSTELVKIFVDHGASVNSSDNKGNTPLMLCSDGIICQMLIDNGADIETCDINGQTALSKACIHGHIDNVEVLVEHGACVNCSDSTGLTPLMLCQDTDTISLLLYHGANADEMDMSYQTALYYALNGMTYDDELNRVILNELPHEERDKMSDVLIASGASEVYSPEQTQGLLLTLKQNNYTLAINTLLSRDWVLVNCKDPERGQTPLMLFARDGETDFMDKVISHGALLDELDQNGKTALMYGSMPRHQCSSVMRLVAAGADVNISDHEGRNALMFTCKSGCYNCTEKILARGGDINAITDHGHTSITYALTNKTLRSLGSFSNTRDLVKLLLVNGATLDFCKFPNNIVRDIKKYYIVYDYIIFLYTMLLQYSCRQCVFRLVNEIRAITDNTHSNIKEFSVITKNKAADIASILQSQDNDTVGIAKCYSMAFTGLLQQYPKEIRLEHIAAMAAREAYGIDYLRSLVERGDFPERLYDMFVNIVTPE